VSKCYLECVLPLSAQIDNLSGRAQLVHKKFSKSTRKKLEHEKMRALSDPFTQLMRLVDTMTMVMLAQKMDNKDFKEGTAIFYVYLAMLLFSPCASLIGGAIRAYAISQEWDDRIRSQFKQLEEVKKLMQSRIDKRAGDRSDEMQHEGGSDSNRYNSFNNSDA